MGRMRPLTLFGQIGSYPTWEFVTGDPPVAIGLRFKVSENSHLIAVAWLQIVTEPSVHIMQLGNTDTGVVEKAFMSDLSPIAGGEGEWAWKRGYISRPWALAADTLYELTVWHAAGNYAAALGNWPSEVDAPPFTVPAPDSPAGPSNSIFEYGLPRTTITQPSYGNTYSIDPVIQPD